MEGGLHKTARNQIEARWLCRPRGRFEERARPEIKPNMSFALEVVPAKDKMIPAKGKIAWRQFGHLDKELGIA